MATGPGAIDDAGSFRWLRGTTTWERVGRLLPVSWILLLAWPVALLLVRGTSGLDLAASLIGAASFGLVWCWFWLRPMTGRSPWPSIVALAALTSIGAAMTFTNPYIWHDGILGFIVVVAAVWPGWRPAVLAVPGAAALILLAMAATGSGIVTALGVALVWLFLGVAIASVLRLFRANLRLHEAQAQHARADSAPNLALSVSPRQAEIMHLVSSGFSDKEIAARLGLSPHTVRTHLQRLYVQHRLRNRAEAAAAWVRHQADGIEDAMGL